MKIARSAPFWANAGKGCIPALSALLLLSSCGKVSEAKAGAESNLTAAMKAPAPVAAAASPTVENANYHVALRPSAGCKHGETCAVEVFLETKGEYHINDKYPYKFKVDEPAPPGLKFPKPVVGKDEAMVEEKKLSLKVPFVAESAGDKRVAGVFSLSVCSAANCLMDKQPLEVTVKVD